MWLTLSLLFLTGKNENISEPLRPTFSRKPLKRSNHGRKDYYRTPTEDSINSNDKEENSCEKPPIFFERNKNEYSGTYQTHIEEVQEEKITNEECNVIVDGIIEFHDLNRVQDLRTDYIETNANEMKKIPKDNAVKSEDSYYSQEEVMEIESILNELGEDKTLNPLQKILGPVYKSMQNCASIEEDGSKTRYININLQEPIAVLLTSHGSKIGLVNSVQNIQDKRDDVVHQTLKSNLDQHLSNCQLYWSKKDGNYHVTEPALDAKETHSDLKVKSHGPEKALFLTPKAQILEFTPLNKCYYDPFLDNFPWKTQPFTEQASIPQLLSLGEELKDSLEIMYGNEFCDENPLNGIPECNNQPVLNEQRYQPSLQYPSISICDTKEYNSNVNAFEDVTDQVPADRKYLMSAWTSTANIIPDNLTYPKNNDSKKVIKSTDQNNNITIEVCKSKI